MKTNEITKKVNVYQRIDVYDYVTGFGICTKDEEGCLFDVNDKYYLGEDEIDSIHKLEVGRSVYSTVISVCFTFDKDELTEAGIEEEMLVEDDNEKVISYISAHVGPIGSEYELLCKCDSNYDEVLYSGLSEEEPGVEYFVNGEDDDEVTLCVDIPVRITVVDGALNIEYML